MLLDNKVRILIVDSAEDKNRNCILLRMKEQLSLGDFADIVIIGKCNSGRAVKEYVEKEEIDLLITFNMGGFEWTTLTNGLAYNILKCKQVHFLLDKSLKNETLLSKQLSIAMFFYCVDAEYRKELLLKYPDIPYLEVLPKWCDNDDLQNKVKSLCVAIEQVIDISRLR